MLEELLHAKKLIFSFPWAQPSWSLFIFLFWLIGSLIYTAASGRGRLLTILVSVYMSKLILVEAPFLTKFLEKHISGAGLAFVNLIIFGGIFSVLFFFLARYVFKTSFDGHSTKSLIFAEGFAFLQVGLLINISLNLLPAAAKTTLHPLVHYLFIRPEVNFIWLVLPVIYLIVFGKHLTSKHEM
ncbi:MAG TPA: hypothetical protein VEA59_02050 [Patescibacteria group bacterium]|nr:hypothetical protein [Patescibacteria group bacterium]